MGRATVPQRGLATSNYFGFGVERLSFPLSNYPIHWKDLIFMVQTKISELGFPSTGLKRRDLSFLVTTGSLSKTHPRFTKCLILANRVFTSVFRLDDRVENQ